MKRLTKKRLTWIVAVLGFPFNAWLGDWHGRRFGGHSWRADRADTTLQEEEGV